MLIIDQNIYLPKHFIKKFAFCHFDPTKNQQWELLSPLRKSCIVDFIDFILAKSDSFSFTAP